MSRKQGLPERGAGARLRDATAKVDMGGRQTHASVSGRIPIKSDVAPAPPHRPPHPMGMRPAAIGASCQQRDGGVLSRVVEAAL